MTATLSNLYMRVGCASPLLMASRKLVSSTRHRERSIIAVQSRLPTKRLLERKNDGYARAYFPVPQNGVKTEMFSPQNDHTTELNVNFLLTATVRCNVSLCLLHIVITGYPGTLWLTSP